MGKGLGLLLNRALSASVRRPSADDDRFKYDFSHRQMTVAHATIKLRVTVILIYGELVRPREEKSDV